tara:strand:- start:90 stop:707 length:618 start_codon:yes stop_codon:yes gene_type:complete
MTSYTEPRFKVGDLVYTNAKMTMPGYSFNMGNTAEDTALMEEIMQRHNYTKSQVKIEPAVFGVIIDEPPEGTWISDSSTIGREREWEGVENPYEEAEIDIPNSGSVWFLADNERKFFVKWFNKQTRSLGENHTGFQPMTSENGVPKYNKSLHFEKDLNKAPNFVEVLRKRVKQTKQRNVEFVIQERLCMDTETSSGIATKITDYC